MATISKAERARRERNHARGVRAVQRVLSKFAIEHGDPRAWKKAHCHVRMVEEALAAWTPPKLPPPPTLAESA